MFFSSAVTKINNAISLTSKRNNGSNMVSYQSSILSLSKLMLSTKRSKLSLFSYKSILRITVSKSKQLLTRVYKNMMNGNGSTSAIPTLKTSTLRMLLSLKIN